MQLRQLIAFPNATMPYMERYLNDGSPSGFSEKHTTSRQTAPFSNHAYFNLYVFHAPTCFFINYGKIPDPLVYGRENWIFIHPDMVKAPFFKRFKGGFIERSAVKVTPTSSGRTVQLYHEHNFSDYIKLHYDGLLGRVWRGLPYKKAISGPEISAILSRAINDKLLIENTAIFREPGARVVLNGNEEWGMVWREHIPYGNTEETKLVIPMFSLFSLDRKSPSDLPLLAQIIMHRGDDPFRYVIDELISLVIKCYFDLIMKTGLQPEWNAQNLLIGVDKNFNITNVIMRDLESIDKDITMMKYLNLPSTFDSFPNKCIIDTQYNYYIKHSFMFDFKLGEYILQPLVSFLNIYYNIEQRVATEKIKSISKKHIELLPINFFPSNGKWYAFSNVLVDQSKSERPYVEYANPKFR